MRYRNFFVLLMLLLLTLAAPGWAVEGQVHYIEYTWDNETQTLSSADKTVDTYTVVPADNPLSVPWTNGWYVVNENVNISNAGFVISGTVNLILCDGATLTVDGGISVNSGATLNIYAQSEGDRMGKLLVTATGAAGVVCKGSLTIHGGTVEATSNGDYAGIDGKSGTVTIYGGTVTATGKGGGAGIGCEDGTVTIHGGTVTATGYAIEEQIYDSSKFVLTKTVSGGAGIGGGYGDTNGGNGGTVTITGGVVTAIGGIGLANVNNGAAGIGGGCWAVYKNDVLSEIHSGGGGTVTITGGTVTATGGTDGIITGAGIGGGFGADDNGTLSIGKGVAVYGGSSETDVKFIAAGQKEDVTERTQYMKAGVAVESVELVSKDVTLTVGETVTLTAKVLPENAMNRDVTWKSSNTDIATVDSDGVVTGVTGDPVTITAASAESADIWATCTVTVKKITPTVTQVPSASAITYGQTLSISTLSGGEVTVGEKNIKGRFEWKNGTITPTVADSGVTEYDVVFNPTETAKYTSADCKVKLMVNPAAATVTAENKSKTYGAADPALTAKVEGLVTGDSENIIKYSLSRTKGENVSTYAITPSGDAEQGNYTVTFKPGTLTINRANATVTADNKSKTTGAADPALTATVSGLVNGDNASVIKYDLSRAAGEAAGKYAITARGDAEQGNYTVTFKPGTLTITEASKPDDPSGELTEEQQAAQQKYEQETADKAQKAEEAANEVDQSSDGGKALANLLNNGQNADGSKSKEEQQQTQAAALEVKEALEESGIDVKDLSAGEVESAVRNKAEERKDAVYEAAGQVKDTTVPAATDLLKQYSGNDDLKEANKDFTVQPKLVEPEVLSEDAKAQVEKNISNVANGTQQVAEGVDSDAVQAAAQQGLLSSKDITIEPASDDLKAQAEAVEKVFNEVSADLAGANEGKGVVIAIVLPRITPHKSGFYPMRVNLRHLLPDPNRQLRFWLSVEHFRRHARGTMATARQASLRTTESGAALAWSAVSEQGTVALRRPAGVELAATGEEGDYFFLDENGVPTAVVSGDPALMTVCAYLEGNKPYTDVFITADATTEKEKAALDDLAEKANPNGGENSPTSNKGSGGCNAGLGLARLLAIVPALALRRRK